MTPNYTYFAFISFQSADAKDAVRLQHAIESYRLPAVLCKNDRSIPRRIKPLYCYLNDMHAGEELMQELKSRMEQSRYLIVVCSPRAAQSAYINSGIDYFVSLGRRDSIIPIIVDGVPYSGDPATECFPKALRRHFPKHADPLQDHSILGINIHEQGVSPRTSYSRAMLMVVARILQLDFDGLLLRDKQRRRKRAIIASLLLCIVVLVLGLTWWFSQTVDVSFGIQEATPSNVYLPPCRDIAVRLTLDNEQKNDTLRSLDDTLLFVNIPPRFIGREVRVECAAKDYLPLDTMLVLQRHQTLVLSRDAAIYGHVRFRLVGVSQPGKQRVQIAGQIVQADVDGQIELQIPITDQRTAYALEVAGRQDSVFMPCGEDDVIVIE